MLKSWKNSYLLLFFSLWFVSPALSQVGITVSPGRLYYRLPPGSRTSQKINVGNPTTRELEIGISIGDWDYDSLGNNISYPAGSVVKSCSQWIQVMPGSYFSLPPNQQQNLDIMLSVPADADVAIPVHTAMLYITQLNPSSAGSNINGASINITVRMGVKLYHSFEQQDNRDIEIIDFADKTVAADNKTKAPALRCLDLLLNNTGKTWIEGKIKWELLDEKTGEKTKLEPLDFYSIPGDKRTVRKVLPGDLKRGRYNATAIINYGERDELKVAELEFDY